MLNTCRAHLQVVPDVLLSQTLQDVEKPTAATSSRSVLQGMISNPAAFLRYKFAIEQARYYDGCKNESDKVGCQIEKALANVGALFIENISGKVSTEVDPRAANDASKLLASAHRLIKFYSEVGVPKDRVLLRIPATWAGIQAAKTLENEGIATHLTLIYSFAQGAAAAQAGVSVVQPNAGRLLDWYNKNPGVIRDRNAPREAHTMAVAGYGAGEAHPGLMLAEKLWSYCQLYHPKTKVMASGLRNKQEALSLAGCDYLVVGPKVLKELNQAPTLEGYNDGLHAGSSSGGEGVAHRLSSSFAKKYEFDSGEIRQYDQQLFEDQLGMAGRALLAEGVARLVEDAERLGPYLTSMTAGQE